ncbi:hypothetical protein K456DRAFT_37588 [Colletotrichum gloeosporioides 23]|nr:hypothetical protein K456DRAFT_37588 [Colletotrichum gloeosporioides 23]
MQLCLESSIIIVLAVNISIVLLRPPSPWLSASSSLTVAFGIAIAVFGIVLVVFSVTLGYPCLSHLPGHQDLSYRQGPSTNWVFHTLELAQPGSNGPRLDSRAGSIRQTAYPANHDPQPAHWPCLPQLRPRRLCRLQCHRRVLETRSLYTSPDGDADSGCDKHIKLASNSDPTLRSSQPARPFPSRAGAPTTNITCCGSNNSRGPDVLPCHFGRCAERTGSICANGEGQCRIFFRCRDADADFL